MQHIVAKLLFATPLLQPLAARDTTHFSIMGRHGNAVAALHESLR